MPLAKNSPETSRADARGFGLIDVIITLAVLAVVLLATVPSTLSTIRTYQRNGAARQVLADIRRTQSLAITRRDVMGYHWGGDPDVDRSASEFRIVRDATGFCSMPAESAPVDGVSVVTGWTDLGDSWAGMTIQSMIDSTNASVAGVMFDSRGRAVNTCGAVTYPVRVTVADSAGNTRVIEIRAAGGTVLL